MEKEEEPYPLWTKGEKLVIDYTGLNLWEIQDMDIDLYLFLFREAYIHGHMQTEEGRKFLEKCWRLSQTKPDRKALREKM